MKRADSFLIILVAVGLVTGIAAPAKAQQSTGGGTSPIMEGKSGEPGLSGAAVAQTQTKRKGCSSGKQITEDRTTGEKAMSGSDTPQGSQKGSSATRSEIASGGGGVTGAVGR